MGEVCAQTLYASAFADNVGALAYDGAIVDGFDPVNAVDWRDFSTFRSASGTSHLEVQVAAAVTVDTVVIWPITGAPAGATIELDSSPDGTTWTNRGSMSVPVDGSISWADLTPFALTAGQWLRFQIVASGTIDWRQLSAGAKLAFPVGQWSGLNPPTLTQGVVLDNVISVNGSIIGRNQRRQEKTGTLALDHLQPTWVRSNWDPFVQAAVLHAFWWRWDPTGHPTEVAFTVSNSVAAPTNMAPAPLMHAEMPISFLTT